MPTIDTVLSHVLTLLDHMRQRCFVTCLDTAESYAQAFRSLTDRTFGWEDETTGFEWRDGVGYTNAAISAE